MGAGCRRDRTVSGGPDAPGHDEEEGRRAMPRGGASGHDEEEGRRAMTRGGASGHDERRGVGP